MLICLEIAAEEMCYKVRIPEAKPYTPCPSWMRFPRRLDKTLDKVDNNEIGVFQEGGSCHLFEFETDSVASGNEIRVRAVYNNVFLVILAATQFASRKLISLILGGSHLGQVAPVTDFIVLDLSSSRSLPVGVFGNGMEVVG